jgi:uncharacterized protein YdbL (DUF1318 family)
MRASHRTRTALFAAAAALLLALAPSARAASLDDAKAAGQVGERPDGYVGLVDSNAPADVKQLVESVNAKRKAEYSRIAQKNGTPVDAVAAIAGQKLIERTPPGQYVMGVDVRWVKK